MIFTTAAVLAATATLVAAADHQIVVGGPAGLVFTPNSIDAVQGDTVTFVFMQKNHTVTQSPFATPCELLRNATTGAVGFDSSFVPVAAGAAELPAWTLEITNDQAPIWFFCAQGNHCQQGMVGAINAPKTGEKTFDAFKALAMGQTAPSVPGNGTTNPTGVGATGGATTTQIPAGSVTTTTTTAAGTSTTTTSAAGGNTGAGMTNRVTGAGVALGAIAALAMVFA